jgi:hypothetical protein
MDVSVKRSAAEFYANVIARGDDSRGWIEDRYLATALHRCEAYLLSFIYSLFTSSGRRAVDAAGDYVRLRSLRFAPTHIHRPYLRRYRVGCNVDDIKSQPINYKEESLIENKE